MDTPRDLPPSSRGQSEKIFLNYKKPTTVISYDDMMNYPSSYGHPFEVSPRYLVP